jgi:hypothetical protein
MLRVISRWNLRCQRSVGDTLDMKVFGRMDKGRRHRVVDVPRFVIA